MAFGKAIRNVKDVLWKKTLNERTVRVWNKGFDNKER